MLAEAAKGTFIARAVTQLVLHLIPKDVTSTGTASLIKRVRVLTQAVLGRDWLC